MLLLNKGGNQECERNGRGGNKGWALMLIVLNLKVISPSIQVSYMLMYLNKPREQRVYQQRKAQSKWL